MYRTIATSFAFLALATPVMAQDVFMPGTSPMDLAPQSQALTSSVIGNLSVGDTARGGGGGGGGGRAYAPPPGRVGALALGRVSDARLPISTTPASRRQALEAFIARAQRKNPQGAAIFPELRRRNIEGELSAAIRPYGLTTTDAADVMTAFLVVGWEIMTGGDATPAQVQGVRRQVAGNLQTVAAIRNPATRLAFAEELKITTMLIGGGGASAKRDGDMAQYRRGVATFYRSQTGENIGSWRLTPAGFQK